MLASFYFILSYKGSWKPYSMCYYQTMHLSRKQSFEYGDLAHFCIDLGDVLLLLEMVIGFPGLTYKFSC